MTELPVWPAQGVGDRGLAHWWGRGAEAVA